MEIPLTLDLSSPQVQPEGTIRMAISIYGPHILVWTIDYGGCGRISLTAPELPRPALKPPDDKRTEQYPNPLV